MVGDLDDADCDGVPAGEDCNDEDDGLGAREQDGDCDGVVTDEDCDDADATRWNGDVDTIYLTEDDYVMGFASVCDHHCSRTTASIVSLTDAHPEDLLNLSCLVGAAGISLGHNPYLANLRGLERLQYLGSIYIRDNAHLTSLSGLEGVTEVGDDLVITNTLALENISALGNVVTIAGKVDISDAWVMSYLGLVSLTSIGKTLTINETEITTLGDLQSLEHLGGKLYIRRNPNLTTLGEPWPLAEIPDTLAILENNALVEFDALQNVQTIGDYISIRYNDSLQNLNGLQSVEWVTNGVTLWDNPALQSIEGLRSMTRINGDFYILRPGPLVNLSGLDNVTSFGGDLHLSQLASLESLAGLEGLREVEGDLLLDETLEDFGALRSLESVGQSTLIRTSGVTPDLSGFQNLVSVGGDLTIISQVSLDATDFLHLRTVGGSLEARTGDTWGPFPTLETVEGDVTIGARSSLSLLEPAIALTRIGGTLEIAVTEDLLEISAFPVLEDVGGSFVIRSNRQLSTLAELGALRSVGGDLQIEDNDMLCANVATSLCSQLGSGLSGECLVSGNDGECH